MVLNIKNIIQSTKRNFTNHSQIFTVHSHYSHSPMCIMVFKVTKMNQLLDIIRLLFWIQTKKFFDRFNFFYVFIQILCFYDCSFNHKILTESVQLFFEEINRYFLYIVIKRLFDQLLHVFLFFFKKSIIVNLLLSFSPECKICNI